MSAPLRLDAEDLRNLAAALDHLTKMHEDTGVDIAVYAPAQVKVGDDGPTVDIAWDRALGQYVIDDRVGS